MKPDSTNHRPSPDYLRQLIDGIKLEDGSVSINSIADTLGIDRSIFRRYIVHEHKSSHRECPYAVQYALEMWVKHNENNEQVTLT